MLVERQVGDDSLQPSVLVLEPAEPTHFPAPQAGVLLLPDVERRLAHADLSADVGDRGVCLDLARDLRDLLLGEPRALHRSRPSGLGDYEAPILLQLQSAVVFGIFVIAFSIVGGILILQHISGPSFSIKRFLSDLAEDRKPRYPLKFRKYDFFNDHADLLNQLYEKYEKK